MAKIDDAAILKRAKENCAKAGLQWEAGELSKSGAPRPKTAGILDDATRQWYLTQAHKQLLDEAGNNNA